MKKVVAPATYLAHRSERSFRFSIFEIPYFISGDAVPTGMGGRGVSPVGAGGSGRSRSGIRLRAEHTPLSWTAVGGGWGELISSGGSVLGGSGSTAVTGRDWMSTGATGLGRTTGERGCRSAPVAGPGCTGCGRTSAACGAASIPAARGGTATGCGGPTSAWRGGSLTRRGWTSTGAERGSVRPGPISVSTYAGRLASTLASGGGSADFWRGSFSDTLVSVFVRLRGGNALASFTALSAGCATGASVSCCGAGRCSLTAAAATGGVGLARRLSATSLAVGPS